MQFDITEGSLCMYSVTTVTGVINREVLHMVTRNKSHEQTLGITE